MVGKRIRLERIMDRNSGKTVIVPMDHGVTLGPMAGTWWRRSSGKRGTKRKFLP